MPRKGENIYKRKDGRWEARYIRDRTESGKAVYGYVYAKSYYEVKRKVRSFGIPLASLIYIVWCISFNLFSSIKENFGMDMEIYLVET